MPGRRAGRELLQLPGPTDVPEAFRRAITGQTLDHRGQQFAAPARSTLAELGPLFATTRPVAVFPGSGSGGEAALVNTCRPGDRVVIYETGHSAAGWAGLARRLGLDVEVLGGAWGDPVDAAAVAEALAGDTAGRLPAVLVVHNETSTGAASDVAAACAAIDGTGHDAMLMVDAVSSLAAMPVEPDAWGADVTITASQKGLMLPAGLVMAAVSAGPRKPGRRGTCLAAIGTSARCCPRRRPARPLHAGIEHDRRPAGGSRPDRRRGCRSGLREAPPAGGGGPGGGGRMGHGGALPGPGRAKLIDAAVVLPDGVDEVALRAEVLDRFGATVGGGLGQLACRCLPVGHLGDVDELMVIPALAALEMVLTVHGLASPGGV